jgi:hypothetical protein
MSIGDPLVKKRKETLTLMGKWIGPFGVVFVFLSSTFVYNMFYHSHNIKNELIDIQFVPSRILRTFHIYLMLIRGAQQMPLYFLIFPLVVLLHIPEANIITTPICNGLLHHFFFCWYRFVHCATSIRQSRAGCDG